MTSAASFPKPVTYWDEIEVALTWARTRVTNERNSETVERALKALDHLKERVTSGRQS